MSLYIKGMEIPKSLGVCVTIYPDGRVVNFHGSGPVEVVGTAIPVPPHGDLIDRREVIIDANERAYDFWLSDDKVNSTIQFLNEQVTIIEAEGEEE